jgi:hypothetical protein
MSTPRKLRPRNDPGFHPLDSAKLNLAELNAGKVVPTGPVAYGLVAGSPLTILILKALEEAHVQVGPSSAALIGIGLSSLIGYITRGGRRHQSPRNPK